MNKPVKAIVLAADVKYSEQVVTTIKSICYHNKNIKFYLFNRDFSPEWFHSLNLKLQAVNAEIIDIKINNEKVKNYPTYPHINSETTFYRYFISEFVSEDKVLYLDCDLVVNGNLDYIFEIDLEDYFLAASIDIIAKGFYGNQHFNAGVLLINNKRWKVHNITLHLLELTEKYGNQVKDGDQSILNILFENKWLELNHHFNYLVGLDWMNKKHHKTISYPLEENTLPLILHYNTEAKPWLAHYQIPFRKIYWFYYHLEWMDIYQHH